MHLTAAPLRLQPEDGLQCVLPLRRHLRALRLDGCVLLTDAGVPLLAQLRWAAGGCGPQCSFGARGPADVPAALLHVRPARQLLIASPPSLPPRSVLKQRPDTAGGDLLPG